MPTPSNRHFADIDLYLLESTPSRGVVLTELGSKVESYDAATINQ